MNWHYFLEAVSGSELEWKASSGSAFKSKFRSFRGSKTIKTWLPWTLARNMSFGGAIDQRSLISITLTRSRIRIRIKVKSWLRAGTTLKWTLNSRFWTVSGGPHVEGERRRLFNSDNLHPLILLLLLFLQRLWRQRLWRHHLQWGGQLLVELVCEKPGGLRFQLWPLPSICNPKNLVVAIFFSRENLRDNKSFSYLAQSREILRNESKQQRKICIFRTKILWEMLIFLFSEMKI